MPATEPAMAVTLWVRFFVTFLIVPSFCTECEVDCRDGQMYSDAREAEPKITPFDFPAHLKLGEKTSVTCMATGGTPMKFKWLKNGSDVSSSTVTIINSEELSTIFIKNISPSHPGNYTCVVENSFGSDRFTASLSVKCEFS